MLVSTEPAGAAQSPPGCVDNDFVFDVAQSALILHPGDTITYTVSAGNPNTSGVGCDIQDVTITGTRPNGTTAIVQTGGSYPIGTPEAQIGTFTYVVSAADEQIVDGLRVVIATARATGESAGLIPDPFDFMKQVSAFVLTSSIEVAKECVDAAGPGEPIIFTGTVTNLGDAVLSAVECVDSITGPLSVPSSLQPGGSAGFSGSYVPSSSPSVDTVTCTGTDVLGQTVTDTATATCTVGLVAEICRTPRFWATHAGAEKRNSVNITQAVIDAAGGSLRICGATIDDTDLNSASSAEEALCVPVQGSQKRQLARQLTAAALNCVISGGGADCSASSIAEFFGNCNSLCADGQASADDVTECITAIECFNNGFAFADGACTTSATGCQDRPLVNSSLALFFDPPGPAGSKRKCNGANKTACTAIPPGDTNCALP